jgi:hypothetical protein
VSTREELYKDILKLLSFQYYPPLSHNIKTAFSFEPLTAQNYGINFEYPNTKRRK